MWPTVRALTVLTIVVALAGCGNDGASVDPTTAPASESSEGASPPDAAPAGEPLTQPESSEPEQSSDAPLPASPPRVAANVADVPLDQMALARPSGKIGAPVDVRYVVSGVVAKDQPATVQLAFIPRVAGSNLQVQFPETAGVTIETGERDLQMQKTSPNDVVRHRLLVTPTAGDVGEMRAIVSMELDGARFFTVYSIPIGSPDQAESKRRPKG